MPRRTSLMLALALLATTVLVSRAEHSFDKVLIGKVVAVSDGDTLTLLDADRVQHKIRLEGIDAPEAGQAFGAQSKKALSERVFSKDVRVQWKAKDKYGRTLGHIYIGERWINQELVSAGMAWHYKEYSSDQQLADAELSARKVKAGLWHDKEPVAPWDYRHAKKKVPLGLIGAVPEKLGVVDPTADSIVFVTKSGTKYHREGCRTLSKSMIAISLKEAQRKYSPCSICSP